MSYDSPILDDEDALQAIEDLISWGYGKEDLIAGFDFVDESMEFIQE